MNDSKPGASPANSSTSTRWTAIIGVIQNDAGLGKNSEAAHRALLGDSGPLKALSARAALSMALPFPGWLNSSRDLPQSSGSWSRCCGPSSHGCHDRSSGVASPPVWQAGLLIGPGIRLAGARFGLFTICCSRSLRRPFAIPPNSSSARRPTTPRSNPPARDTKGSVSCGCSWASTYG